jgi:hypothetical protein
MIIWVRELLVEDKEVEQRTEYWRSTGVPEYISATIQKLEEDDSNLEHFDNDGISDIQGLCRWSKYNEKSQSAPHNAV